MRKGDGPWIAAATCAIPLAVLLVCIMRWGWPLADSVVLAFGAGCLIFAVLTLVSIATNDGTPELSIPLPNSRPASACRFRASASRRGSTASATIVRRELSGSRTGDGSRLGANALQTNAAGRGGMGGLHTHPSSPETRMASGLTTPASTSRHGRHQATKPEVTGSNPVWRIRAPDRGA